MVAAAGDAGSSDCYDPNPPVDDTDTSLQVDDPADQPYVTGVGGTSLTSAGANAPSESVWNNSLGAGGGGVSTVFPAPSWQSGVGATHREVPDVSASADPEWGDVVYWEGTWGIVGGTSQASPLWAALVAVGNQGCAARSGLLNPALYSATTGSFNDITVGGNDLVTPGGTHYPATTGYDLASGWGTPRAPGLMTVLSGSSTGCPALTGLSAHSGPAVGGQHRGHQRNRIRLLDPDRALRKPNRHRDRPYPQLDHGDRTRRHLRRPDPGDGHHLRSVRRDDTAGAGRDLHLRLPPGDRGPSG